MAVSSSRMDRDVVANTLGAAAMRLLELRLARELKIPDPQPQSNAIATVPGGVIWELLEFRFSFTTDANVGNRFIQVAIFNPDGLFKSVLYDGTAIAAGLTVSITGSTGAGTFETSSPKTYPLPSPPIPLLPGSKIQTFISGMAVGDQVSSFLVTVRQWSESDVLQELSIISQQLTSQVMPEIIS